MNDAPQADATSTDPSRRDAQRQRLRQELRAQRQAEIARTRRTRTTLIAALVILALAIAAGLGYLIHRSTQPAPPPVAPSAIGDSPYLTLGAPEGSGTPVVEIHLDFMCPHCGVFEDINAEDVSELVETQQATVNLVPRRFMDASSSTGDYSSRAANAMVCVYEDDPANTLDYQQAVFAQQASVGNAGLSDEELWSYAEQAGASPEVNTCITERTHQSWVRQVVDPYGDEVGGGTPFVRVDDTVIEDWSTPGALRSAVESTTRPEEG